MPADEISRGSRRLGMATAKDAAICERLSSDTCAADTSSRILKGLPR